ncbi:thyroglobulin-like [Gigantopelta aegis]|uniref:thyroglobulin-like n=1 Tax=Gigantopelta aegis TaxID=1735272 RepID=UPI001B88C8A2|nr:thyroglobulin-like [Gigantopelta aegis]
MHFTLLVCLLPLLAVAEKACNVAHEEWAKANANGPLPGAVEPRCDENGQYRDRICSGTDCWCVKPNGDEIPDYHHRITELNVNAMDCKCARVAAEYMETGLIGLYYSCTKEGGYEAVQCRGSTCFCTDVHGVKVGAAVRIEKSYTLKCSRS